MPERLTRRNPNHTYRVPMADQKNDPFRMAARKSERIWGTCG